ncbi:PRD domain-containing protein [Microbacterium hydrothermale]|nr:PRD domain-containing protein [Microbacterium hydrothermale]
MRERHPGAVTIAERVRTFIDREYGVAVPAEEVAYLALHVERASLPCASA